MFTLLSWIIIGGLSGWLAGKISKGRGFGLIGNVVIGIAGGFIGGLTFSLIGFSPTSIIGTVITCVVGALILLYFARKFR